jgi:hypothetical protein
VQLQDPISVFNISCCAFARRIHDYCHTSARHLRLFYDQVTVLVSGAVVGDGLGHTTWDINGDLGWVLAHLLRAVECGAIPIISTSIPTLFGF